MSTIAMKPRRFGAFFVTAATLPSVFCRVTLRPLGALQITLKLTQPRRDQMSFKVLLTDTEAGETREVSEEMGDFDDAWLQMWTRGRGNFGCDCNRYLMFYGPPNDSKKPGS